KCSRPIRFTSFIVTQQYSTAPFRPRDRQRIPKHLHCPTNKPLPIPSRSNPRSDNPRKRSKNSQKAKVTSLPAGQILSPTATHLHQKQAHGSSQSPVT